MLRKIYEKNTDEIKVGLIVLFIMICFYGVIDILGMRFASSVGDYVSQHIKIIDYLRMNFKETGDLFPQLNTNLGGGQSFVSMYYYGMYNPYILLSYLVPSISTIKLIGIIHIFSAVLTASFMMKLLKIFDVKRIICYIICILIIFTPSFFTHFQVHMMFVYFFPYFILSLIAIHSLVKQDKIILFIITNALMFVFNFSFAVSIFIFQFAFFIVLSIHYKLTWKEIFTKLLRAAFSYIIGLGIAAMVVYPQLMASLGGDRTVNAVTNIPLISNGTINAVVFYSYNGALGLIAPFSCVYAIVNRKRDKLTYYLSIFLVLVLVSGHLNLVLNAFVYIHAKILMFLIPLIFLLFARVLDSIYTTRGNTTKKYLVITAIICLIIMFAIIYNGGLVAGITMFITEYSKVYQFLIVSILSIIILVIAVYKNNKAIMITITLLSCLFNIVLFSSLITKKDFKLVVQSQTNLKYDFSENDEFQQSAPRNKVMNINHSNPAMYTSLLNSYYVDFFNYYLALPRGGADRITQNNAFDNMLVQKYFGINYHFKEEGRIIKKKINTKQDKPSVYTVEDKDVYNVSGLNKLSNYDRNFAINMATFSDTSINKFEYKKLKNDTIVVDESKVVPKKDILKEIELPNDLVDGDLVTVQIYADKKSISEGFIYAKDHITNIRGANLYGEAAIDKATFLMDGRKLRNKKLKIRYKKSANIYNKLIVKRYKEKELAKLNIPYQRVDSYKKIANKGYDINAKMNNSGYLVTKVPYDDGFIITNNNKKVNAEKIDGHFVGVKLNKGENNIKIRYQIAGFKTGMNITIVSCLLFGGVIVTSFIRSRRSSMKIQ